MNWLRLLTFGFLMAAVVPRPDGTLARANEVDFKKQLPSVVWVISPDGKNLSTGSGVLIDARRGLILTAAHVVGDRPAVTVFFAIKDANGKIKSQPAWYLERVEKFGAQGRVIAADKKHDLALIQIERVPSTAREVAIARESTEPGESLYSIGNSGAGSGALWRYFSGEVRQVYPTVLHYEHNLEVEAQVVETTLPSNPGDSGGPILNTRGELVGITSGGQENERAVSFGIDVLEIHALLEKEQLTPESPVPVATILNQSLERDVFREGRKGVLARVSFEIKGANGVPCEVMAFLYDASGRPIASREPSVSVVGGTLGVVIGVKPDRDNVTYRDFTLFIPDEAIRKSIPATPGELFEPVASPRELWCSVQIRELEQHRWIVENGITTSFRFDRTATDNGRRPATMGR